MSEQEQRAAVVAAARAWLGTPYHHMGRLKGVGCDCAMFPAEVYHAAGRLPRIEVESYPIDWNLHRDQERYLAMVRAHARRTAVPLPGDFVLYRWGRTLAHGAIVLAWPMIIHAVRNLGVVEEDASLNARLADPGRERHFYTLW
jgi:cell wall-associated NlpC family hydrolase